MNRPADELDAAADADLEVCRELVIGGHGWNAVTRLFSPDSRSPRYLAGRALAESLLQIPGQVSDPGVALAKAGWWAQQLSAPDAPSEHPVLRSMASSAAWDCVDPNDYASLLAETAGWLDPPPFASVDDLLTTLERQGQQLAQLEARLLGATTSPENISAWAAEALSRRLASLVFEAQNGRWWLPMDVQAKSGLTRERLVDAPGGEATMNAVTEVVRVAAGRWFGRNEHESGWVYGRTKRAVAARRLAWIIKHPGPDGWASAGRCRPADVWVAWRAMRRGG